MTDVPWFKPYQLFLKSNSPVPLKNYRVAFHHCRLSANKLIWFLWTDFVLMSWWPLQFNIISKSSRCMPVSNLREVNGDLFSIQILNQWIQDCLQINGWLRLNSMKEKVFRGVHHHDGNMNTVTSLGSLPSSACCRLNNQLYDALKYWRYLVTAAAAKRRPSPSAMIFVLV